MIKQELKQDSQVIQMAQNGKSRIVGDKVIIYTTFNIYPMIINRYRNMLKGRKCIALLDSALYTIPYRDQSFKDDVCTVYTTSKVNQNNFHTLGIEIPYIAHFVPDPNPTGEILSLKDRKHDFLTVGINETDFDRKGHYWAWITQRWGFNTISVCKNLCFGNHVEDLPDNQLWELMRDTRWYLATSHSETPHLPLIESYAFGTPAVYLSAHEFEYIGVGIPIRPTFHSVKGFKNFYFAEIDSLSFLDAIGEATKIDESTYSSLSQVVREKFEKEFSMNKRLDEFRKLMDYEI